MPQQLRIGILGAGDAGRAHAQAYSRNEGVAVTALWSRTRERAESLASELSGRASIQVYDRWEDLVAESEIDILSVATPTTLRLAPVAAAVSRGLHILVEKPFAMDLAEAREMVHVAAQARTVTAVSLNWRYAPGSLTAARLIRTGAIGQIAEVHQDGLLVGSMEQFTKLIIRKPFVGRQAEGGGMLREGGSHTFDRIHFITGKEYRAVSCRLSRTPVPDHPDIDVDFGSLIYAELAPSGSATIPSMMMKAAHSPRRLTFYGETGIVTMSEEQVLLQRIGDAEPSEVEIPASDRAQPDIPMLQHTWNRLIADFVTAVRADDRQRRNVPALPTFADGLRTTEMICAAERSDAEQRWVKLADMG